MAVGYVDVYKAVNTEAFNLLECSYVVLYSPEVRTEIIVRPIIGDSL